MPIISFTFDDFPRSALFTGGEILRCNNIGGTYYTSFGLMGQNTPTGLIFQMEDLPTLLKNGHELGCHTFAHCNAWDTPPQDFARSIEENHAALQASGLQASFQTLSYPIAGPHPAVKTAAASHFLGCRGGGQRINARTVDLNHINAHFIEQSKGDIAEIDFLLKENERHSGWLVFATHDVTDNHTRYGCTPRFFEQVVKAARATRAQILPVAAALKVVCSKA